MTIEYIHIKNSFAHKNSKIDFKSGVNYLIGNYGSGKSEALEMIGFSFFGAVALRGKASTYPKLEVELVFNYVESKYKIIRTSKDAKILKDNVEVANSSTGVNNYIIKLLGYDYNIYTLSNYCQQNKLQYFSELTTGKRAQYIDKLNGIEDAKNFITYLKDVVKKGLKVSLETHRSLLRVPEKPDIDLDVDYEDVLKKLPIVSDEVSKLTLELKELRDSLIPVPSNPIKPKLDLLLIEDFDSVLKLFNDYVAIEKSLDVLDREKRELLAPFPPKIRSTNMTYDKAKVDLHSLLHNSLITTNISCPSCNHTFSTEELKDPDFVTQYSISELELIVQWLTPSLQDSIKEITKVIEDFELQLESLPVEQYCSKYITSLKFKSERDYQLALNKDYEDAIENIKNIVASNQVIQNTIETINLNVSNLLSSQQEVTDRKILYSNNMLLKNVYGKAIAVYLEALEVTNTINSKIIAVDSLLYEINSIVNRIQQESLPSISKAASLYLERLTSGVMHNIVVTDTYELLVDGSPINLRSGAQKDLASLSFRLSLGKSIVHGMLPLFIGDEVDAASTPEVAIFIRRALQELSKDGTQIIIVTHKDVVNYEDCNVINLG